MKEKIGKKSKRNRRRGQAIGELLAALVGITVVFAVVIQVAYSGHESIMNLFAAREEAESNAQGNVLARTTNYVGDWNNGDDGLRYTADDVAVNTGWNNSSTFMAEMEQPLAYGELVALGAHDGISPLAAAGSLAEAADLFEGEKTRSVPIEPVLQTFAGLHHDRLHLKDFCVFPGLRIENPE